MAKVRVIPSTINPVTLSPLGQLNRRKVAAYARVSTDDEEQATSYETQVKHYTEFIQKNPNGSLLKFMPIMVFLEQVPREEKVSMK